jgi:hypothetical protein
MVIDKLEGIRKEAVVASLTYCPRLFLEGLEKYDALNQGSNGGALNEITSPTPAPEGCLAAGAMCWISGTPGEWMWWCNELRHYRGRGSPNKTPASNCACVELALTAGSAPVE